MIRVITYGTYDVLHYGHVRFLERAKALGDYLIVAVTADDFDKARGKINVKQSLMERVEAVKALGIADEIIIEEYEGQKIDDICRYNIDIFTVGSDWFGKFDYLNEYCKVVYLDRTPGVSSSDIRSKKREIRLGLIGDASFLNKIYHESQYVNGINVVALYTINPDVMEQALCKCLKKSFEDVINETDAVYIRSIPYKHFSQIKYAFDKGVHVLCESPLTLDHKQVDELFELARHKGLVFMEGIKTAYSTAFARLMLLAKTGKIGNVVSVDATCTSLKKKSWPGFFEWAPTALLPIFELLGASFEKKYIVNYENSTNGLFSKIDFVFRNAVASIKVGDGVKSEGQLIISGTKGYIFVPAPWWNTDYFEIRYEDISENKRYFYQLEGEGIRHELVAFVRAIESGKQTSNIKKDTSIAITNIMEDYVKKNDVIGCFALNKT